MYRLIIESLLGLRLEADKLHLATCLPADWPGITIHYRYRETVYHIAVRQQEAGSDQGQVLHVIVDGAECPLGLACSMTSWGCPGSLSA